MAAKIQDSDKVKALLNYYKMTQMEFAARLGVSQPTLAHWIGRNKIPYLAMDKIAQVCPEIAFSWLMTGIGPMLTKDGGKTETEMSECAPYSPKSILNIPGLDCDDLIQCQGISMPPNVQQGDYIGIKALEENIDPERIYLIELNDGSQMLRRIAHIEDEGCYELSADSNRRPMKVSHDNVKSIKKVVFVGRFI